MQCLEAEREQELQRQHNRPVITSGDIVKVVYKNATQPSRPLKFTAVCAVVRHKGPRTSMILMRSIDGEIVEYDLPLYSPWLEDISVVGRVRPEKKYLRSRLYYLKSDGKKNKRWFLIRPPHAHFPKEINNR
ncbi:unnamed protein product [Pedinophyceae sp. YPF-701]|nr:unnamed protein product [Pedinophyceae sp. YPF-701]